MNRTIGLQAQVKAGIVRGVPRDDHGVLAFKGIPLCAPGLKLHERLSLIAASLARAAEIGGFHLLSTN